jgi:copper chaperone CopZ
MNKITVHIEGMMCSMCESHINDTIRKHFPVKKVTSSHSRGQTVILTEENLTEAQLHEALDPTGYQVTGVTVEPYERRGLLGLFGRG